MLERGPASGFRWKYSREGATARRSSSVGGSSSRSTINSRSLQDGRDLIGAESIKQPMGVLFGFERVSGHYAPCAPFLLAEAFTRSIFGGFTSSRPYVAILSALAGAMTAGAGGNVDLVSQ
jgi:hypothetical protein